MEIKTPHISIIIVNYNVRHLLEQCLIAVFRALEDIDSEVIVVDNASKDDSVAMLRTQFEDKITLIANAHNPGFSTANNQGIRIAKGRYVLLLNPDTVVAENTFAKCLAFMDAHETVGGLGVKMIDGTGEFLPESKRALPTPWVSFYKIFGLAALFPRSHRFGQYHLTFLDKEQNHAVEILSGAFMLMRKDLLDRIGYLDEDFFMYGEDVDLSYRIVQAGYENYYFADTQIIHYKGESTKKGSLNYVKVFYQAMIIFARKHFAGGHQRNFIHAIRFAVWFRALLAVLYRLVMRYGFAVLEAGLIFGVIEGIKSYWEHNVKYVAGGHYPATFDWIAAPIYTLVFTGLLWAMGAYQKPYKIRPLVAATLAGFAAIATVSFLFPQINFSRAIVGLTSVFTLLMTLTTRGFANWRTRGNFFFAEPKRHQIWVIASPDNLTRVEGTLRAAWPYPVDVVGNSATTASLSLPLSLFRIDEVVICASSVSNGDIIAALWNWRKHGAAFRIVPPERDFAVGAHALFVPSAQRKSKLTEPEHRKAKRRFEVFASLAMLVAFPVIGWGFHRPMRALRACVQVLAGTHTLVGLPEAANSFLSLVDKDNKEYAATTDISAIAAYYAQQYSWELDAEILQHAWRKLGA